MFTSLLAAIFLAPIRQSKPATLASLPHDLA
jgi:hypothetical protein